MRELREAVTDLDSDPRWASAVAGWVVVQSSTQLLGQALSRRRRRCISACSFRQLCARIDRFADKGALCGPSDSPGPAKDATARWPAVHDSCYSGSLGYGSSSQDLTHSAASGGSDASPLLISSSEAAAAGLDGACWEDDSSPAAWGGEEAQAPSRRFEQAAGRLAGGTGDAGGAGATDGAGRMASGGPPPLLAPSEM